MMMNCVFLKILGRKTKQQLWDWCVYVQWWNEDVKDKNIAKFSGVQHGGCHPRQGHPLFFPRFFRQRNMGDRSKCFEVNNQLMSFKQTVWKRHILQRYRKKLDYFPMDKGIFQAYLQKKLKIKKCKTIIIIK